MPLRYTLSQLVGWLVGWLVLQYHSIFPEHRVRALLQPAAPPLPSPPTSSLGWVEQGTGAGVIGWVEQAGGRGLRWAEAE